MLLVDIEQRTDGLGDVLHLDAGGLELASHEVSSADVLQVHWLLEAKLAHRWLGKGHAKEVHHRHAIGQVRLLANERARSGANDRIDRARVSGGDGRRDHGAN